MWSCGGIDPSLARAFLAEGTRLISGKEIRKRKTGKIPAVALLRSAHFVRVASTLPAECPHKTQNPTGIECQRAAAADNRPTSPKLWPAAKGVPAPENKVGTGHFQSYGKGLETFRNFQSFQKQKRSYKQRRYRWLASVLEVEDAKQHPSVRRQSAIR